MDANKPLSPLSLDDYEPKFTGFYDLMPFRVREILLVSSPYDAFVLSEDGRLSDRVFEDYVDLKLQLAPRITHVSTAGEALSALNRLKSASRRFRIRRSSTTRSSDASGLDLSTSSSFSSVMRPVGQMKLAAKTQYSWQPSRSPIAASTSSG